MTQKIKLKNGIAIIPSDWIILNNGINPTNATTVGIVEVQGMGDIPHFAFLTDKPCINMLTSTDLDSIVQLCSATCPDLLIVWTNDKRLGNDCAHIGFFDIPTLGQSPILPYGHDCILIPSDKQG